MCNGIKKRKSIKNHVRFMWSDAECYGNKKQKRNGTFGLHIVHKNNLLHWRPSSDALRSFREIYIKTNDVIRIQIEFFSNSM